MKKQYVAPQAKVYNVKLSKAIMTSAFMGDGDTSGMGAQSYRYPEDWDIANW